MFHAALYKAELLEPCVRLRIGPGIDDVFEFSQAKLDDAKADIETFCRSLPHLDDGGSWKVYRAYTNWDGLSAKVLIVLGEHLGIWRSHPPQGSPELWTNDVYPTILGGTLEMPHERRTPKPSTGDLEVLERVMFNTTDCSACGRPMGPWDSSLHMLVAGEPGGHECIECAAGIGS